MVRSQRSSGARANDLCGHPLEAISQQSHPRARRAQSERFGTKIFSETVTHVNLSSRPFKVYTAEKEARQPSALPSRPAQGCAGGSVRGGGCRWRRTL